MRNQNHQRTYQKIQNEDNGGLKQKRALRKILCKKESKQIRK